MKFSFKILFICLMFVSVFIFTGCEKKSSKSPLIGSWKHSSGYIYTFNGDKTGNYSYNGKAMEFTYEDKDGKVSILYTGNTDASEYEYKIEGKKLIIKDSFGNDVEYIKK